MKPARPHNVVRVLLVEPSRPVRELVSEYLRGRGLVVVAVPSAAAARVSWAEATHDVLLTETALPDGDGAELIRHCADPHANPTACGFLAVSGALTVPEAVAVMQAGAEDVLLKPLRLREVFDAVRASAQRARVRARDRLARELFLGAAACESAVAASALRAILDAEAPLMAGDAVLAAACARVVAMAEERCR